MNLTPTGIHLGMFSRRKNTSNDDSSTSDKNRTDQVVVGSNGKSSSSYDVEGGVLNPSFGATLASSGGSGTSSNIIYNGPSSQKLSAKSRHSSAAAVAAASSCSSFVFGGQAYQQVRKRRRRPPQKHHRFLLFRLFSSLLHFPRLFLILLALLLILLVLYTHTSTPHPPQFTTTTTTMKHTTTTTTTTTSLETNNNNMELPSSSKINAENNQQHHPQQQQQRYHHPQQQQQHNNRPLLLDLSQLPSLEWERQREIDRRHHLDNDVANNDHNQIHHNQIHHNSEQINQLLETIVPKWAKRHEEPTNNSKKKIKANPSHIHGRESKAIQSTKGTSSSGGTSSSSRTLHTMITNKNTTSSSCPPLTNPSIVSVSLVIHSTLDRLWIMEETCRRWTNPIVLVVYYNNRNNTSVTTTNSSEPWRQILDWSLVCPQVKLVPVLAGPHEQDWQYPVNRLRNIGLDALETPLFLMMDVDFLPSENLQQAITQHCFSTYQYYHEAKTQQRQQGQNKIAMVVPAFERRKASCTTVNECQEFLKHDPHFIPRSFEEIGFCVKSGHCGVFQGDDNWEGHYTTDSESWLRGDFYETRAIQSHSDNNKVPRKLSCFHSYRYEPYLVLPWCKNVTPYYDERFYGYGKNKIEYISHLRFLNYSFHVLPEGFLVHHPHPNSKAKAAWNDMEKHYLHAKMDELYPKFLAELQGIYGMPSLRQCKS
jgi:hypothetical protein